MSKKTKTIVLIVIVAVLAVALVCGIALRNALFLPFGPYFGEQNSPGVKQSQFEADPQGIKNINLDFVSEQISVVATNENKIRIEETSNTQMNANDVMQCSVSGNTVVAESGMHDNWFNVFDWSRYGDIKVTLYIPASYQNNLGLHSVSGQINAQGFNSSGLKVDTTSGRINASGIQAATADIGSTSGEISLQNVQSAGLTMHETSGAITLVGGRFDTLSAHSTSGAISLDAQRMGKIDAGSTSGSVSVSVSEMPGQINIGTVSGSVNVTLPENDGFTLDTHTVSGAVNNDFAMAHGVYKNGGGNITLSTTSGFINIIKK